MNAITDAASDALQDITEIATWNRPRSLTELKEFIFSHDEALDVEEFSV